MCFSPFSNSPLYKRGHPGTIHCPKHKLSKFTILYITNKIIFFFFNLLVLPESENKSDEIRVNVDDKTMTRGNLENIQRFLSNCQCHKFIVRCLSGMRIKHLELNLQGLDWHERDYIKGHRRGDKTVHHSQVDFKKPAFLRCWLEYRESWFRLHLNGWYCRFKGLNGHQYTVCSLFLLSCWCRGKSILKDTIQDECF